MGRAKVVILLAFVVFIGTVCCQVSQGGSHQDQGGPHGPQGRSRRQAPQEGPEIPEDPDNIIASCNNVNTTSLSCYDCSTRLICKPHSIVLVRCRGNVKPFCYNGICSAVQSPEC